LPAAVVAKLGPSKKLAVKVAFNRYTLQGWIDDGGFMIPTSAAAVINPDSRSS
jgi:hypothetical protein